MAKSGKSKKTGNEVTPVAPKDIKGDVTTENELSPQDAAAPRSSRKRAGDFNDFEDDEAVIGDTGKETGASPTQPKKKPKTTSATEKNPKPSKTDGHLIMTEKADPGGDMVETDPAEEPTTQRKTSRKTAGKSKATREEIQSNGDKVQHEAAEESRTQKKANKKPGRKSKAAEEDSKPTQVEKDPAKKKAAESSKTNDHLIETEKTHPGGDRVEVQPAEESTNQEEPGKKITGGKPKAAKEGGKSAAVGKDIATEKSEPQKEKTASKKKGESATKSKSSAKVKATEKPAEKGKSRPDSDKAKERFHAEEVPSQAQAVHKVAAPKKNKEPSTAEPKSKSQKAKKATDAEAKADVAKGKAKAPKAAKATESKDDDGGDNVKPPPAEDTGAEPDQTMDEAPFTKLLKRERAKIPSVKASANAAEAERKAHAASEASKGSDKPAKAPKIKESKPAAKDKKTTDTEAPGEASKAAAPKGKKRKDDADRTDTKSDSAPSGKKQKKSRPSALEAATSAVGDLVNSGIEAAAQGVSAVKDIASGLGNKSLAEDITTEAEDAAEQKSKKAKAKKEPAEKAAKLDKGKGKEKDAKSDEGKGKEKAVEADAAKNGSGVDEGEEEEDYEEGDQTLALIKGFESQEEDDGPSIGEGFKEGQSVPDLPTKKDVEKKLNAVKDTSDVPGVVYVGRIPHGFYESQMRAYFGQFGHISRLRLSRNRTTGNSKHYAFIEFASSDVAKIVAETMDNYLMFGHILKCKVVPPGDVHENLWKGANKRFKKVPWSKIEGKKLERKVGREEWGKRVEGERKKRERKSEKLKSIGYEFEAPKLKGPEDVPIREGEKSIEGPSAEGGTFEEKTIVTTDGGDGTMVISEEVKTTKVKKDGKRKAEEKTEEGPLAEVVQKAKKVKKSAA
ncbi:MAG: hypothetical protein Q9209_003926 [Squamulea sp. 1 TL-2023]